MTQKLSFTLVFLLFFTGGLRAQLPLEKQVAYLSFDEGSADAYSGFICLTEDSVSYGDSRKGSVNKALWVGGSSPTVTYQDSGLLHPELNKTKTLTCWIKTSGKGRMIMYGDSADLQKGGWEMGVDESGFLYVLIVSDKKGATPARISTQKKFATNEWVHVGLLLAPAQKIELYINGQRDTVLEWNKSIRTNRTAKIQLGGRGIDAVSGISFDDIRVFDGTMSTYELNQIYTAGITTIQVEVDLGKPQSAFNSATIQVKLSPDGKQVLIANKDYKRITGFTFRLMDRKSRIIDEFPADQKEYSLDYSKWNNDPICFLQVLGADGLIIQIYRLNLNF